MFKVPLLTGLSVAGSLLFPFSADPHGRHEARNMPPETHSRSDMQPASQPFRRHGGIRLPKDLTPRQREAAYRILTEAEPRLIALRERLFAVMVKLRSLSFSQETPHDVLSTLGRELVETRDRLLRETRRVNARLAQEAGFNPGWGTLRGCGALRAGDGRLFSAPPAPSPGE